MLRPANLLLNLIVLVLLLAGGTLLLLQAAGFQLLSVQSGSMAPALHKGDLVAVKNAPHYNVGDVITFTRPAQPAVTITHRVTEVTRQGRTLQTQGDANERVDSRISKRSVVGKVNYSIPYVGYAIDTLRHPVGLLAIIYLPAIWIIVGEIRRLAAYYQSQTIYRLISWVPSRKKQRHVPLISPVSGAALACSMAIIVVAFVVAPVRAALGTTATLTGNTITAFIPRTYLVCNFPADNSLLSYSPVDAFIPRQELAPLPLSEPILPGTYKITALSHDDHIANPYEPSQPNERWFMQLYAAGASAPTYTTGITDDLPDSIDQNATVMNDSITFTQTVTGIRYVHNAANTGFEKDQFGGRRFDDLSQQEKRQVLWNSIHPGCITLESLAGN